MKLAEFHDGRNRSLKRIRVADCQLFGDMDCLRIETPGGTYYYGKVGAGFASILDPDGRDWISYRHGGKARGEYRGLPKCGQPVKYFHCGYGFGQYTNDNPFITTITAATPARVQLRSQSRLGDAACEWTFYRDHASLDLLRCGSNSYWFLYEGVPGGALQISDDFVTTSSGMKRPLSQPWEEATAWAIFTARESTWGFWLASHSRAVATDTASPRATYVSWPYKPEPDGGLNQMTVFGWGRLGWQDPKQHSPQLKNLPARFSIGFSDKMNKSAIERKVANAAATATGH